MMLGIFGGTFDPIHYGHLRTALEVKEALGLAELRFLPSHLPPHRGTPGASAEHRLKMLGLALVNGEPGFRVDRREFDREGPSYMVDTLHSLRREIGDRPLFLILGQDAFCGLPSWSRWLKLFELAHIAVMRRPDSPEPEWAPNLMKIVGERKSSSPQDWQCRPAGKVVFLEVTQLAISATDIRRLVAEGKSPRYLLPDPVLDFIREQRLYRDGEQALSCP